MSTSVPVVRRDEQSLAPAESPDIFAFIARAAADPSIDVSKMERMIALRDRELARIAESEFNAAMRECQSEIPLIHRDAKNEHNQAKYARLEKVNDNVVPVYTRHGFSLSFSTAESPVEGCLRLTCRVSHTGGHSRDYQADLPLDGVGAQGKANKTGVQAFGSTVSYGRRYLTLLIFNVTLTNEDTDGRLPGERPDANKNAPKVEPRAQRQLPASQPATVPPEINAGIKSAYGLWRNERAGDDKSWAAFWAWASDVNDGLDLSKPHNWTMDAVKRCEEACK